MFCDARKHSLFPPLVYKLNKNITRIRLQNKSRVHRNDNEALKVNQRMRGGHLFSADFILEWGPWIL